MAFIVEDGTGITNSNAYISVTDFRTYWGDRGVSYGSLTNDQIQGYIVQATQYIDSRYAFKGYPTNDTQELYWPRTNGSGGEIVDTRSRKTIAVNVIPDILKSSMCELTAIINDKGNGNINDNLSNNITSQKVGVMSIGYGSSNGSQYGGSNSTAFSEYRVVTNYIKGVLTTSGVIRV